jgi:hypothetical protein
MTSALQTETMDPAGRIAVVPPAVDEEVEIPAPARPKLHLASVLRWGGGIFLAAAALAFMFQGFHSFDPMTRHWLMLAICGLLGGMGLATGMLLKEEKGARLFLGFAAAAFPALSSQLAAMLHSILGQAPPGMPRPLVFSLVNVSLVAAIAAVTLVLAVSISFLAFKIMARTRASAFTGLYTLGNLCVLLPFRDDVGVGVLLGLLAAFLLWADTAWFRGDFRLNTFEGAVSRLMLVAPPAVIVGRTLFYPMSDAFHGALLVLAGGFLAFFWSHFAARPGVKRLCQLLGQVGMAVGWMICLYARLLTLPMGEGMAVYMALLPVGLVLGLQSLLEEGRAARFYRLCGIFAAFLAVFFAHWLGATSAVSVVGIVAALAMVSIGTVAGEMDVFAFGVVAGAMGLGNFAYQAVQMHSSYAWAALALIGIAVMFSASLIERKQGWIWLKKKIPWGGLKGD